MDVVLIAPVVSIAAYFRFYIYLFDYFCHQKVSNRNKNTIGMVIGINRILVTLTTIMIV